MTAVEWWAGPMVAFDTETTGVDVFNDRIVTAALVEVVPGQRPRHTSWLLNPGVDIAAEATAVHGITTDHARQHGQDPDAAVFEIVGRLALALTRGIPVVAMNAAFDLTIVEAEAARHGVDRLASRLPHGIRPVVDPMVLDKHLDPYRKGRRTLSALVEHYRVILAGAHDSTADALAAARLIPRMVQAHAELTGYSLDSLHSHQVRWRAEQQKSLAAYFRRKGDTTAADTVNAGWPLQEAS